MEEIIMMANILKAFLKINVEDSLNVQEVD